MRLKFWEESIRFLLWIFEIRFFGYRLGIGLGELGLTFLFYIFKVRVFVGFSFVFGRGRV